MAGRDFGVVSPSTWRIADLSTKHAFLKDSIGWGGMPLHMVEKDIASGSLVVLNVDDVQMARRPLEGFLGTSFGRQARTVSFELGFERAEFNECASFRSWLASYADWAPPGRFTVIQLARPSSPRAESVYGPLRANRSGRNPF